MEPQREPRRLRPGAAHPAARAAERGRGARRGPGRREGRRRPAGEAGGGAMILVFVETGDAQARARCRGRPSRSRAPSPSGRAGRCTRSSSATARTGWSTSSAATASPRSTTPPATASRPTAVPRGRRPCRPRWRPPTPTSSSRPGTPRGMEVAAHLAARLDVPMAANVVGIGATDPETGSRCGSPARSWAVRCSRRWCCPSAPRVLTVAGHAVVDEPGVPGAATLREFTPEVAEADLVARVVSMEAVAGARPVGRAHLGAGRRRRRARRRVGRPGSTPPRSWRSCSAARSASPAW